MLDKCANPDCDMPAHYLGHGRLYALYRRKKSGDAGQQRVVSIEFYWLCEHCSESLKLSFTAGQPELMPLTKPADADQSPFVRRETFVE